MQLGMVGLGRMGANLVRRLMRGGHQCVAYDSNPASIDALAREGATPAHSTAALVAHLAPPRTVWIMVPSGPATDAAIADLAARLSPGDTIIDGGNSNWKDAITRSRDLATRGIHFLDVGTSGGVWGLDRGYCLMIGGPTEAVTHLDPIFRTLAPGPGTIPQTPHRSGRTDSTAGLGYLHTGPNGSGHFVKMIHNGIEYGMMQAIAEGFDILQNANSAHLPASHRLDLDTSEIAEVWRRGSVITSWLLDLTAGALAEDPALQSYSGVVADSGEGRWTVEAAIAEAVPAEVLTAALFARFRSRQDHTFAEKILSAMRKGFGGHIEDTAKATKQP